MKNKKSPLFADIVGWVGTGMIILAYAFSTFGLLRTDDSVYLILNVIGSIGIIIISIFKKTYQPAVLNIVWAAVAIAAIVRLFF